MRKWLNSDYLNSAFDEKERKAIIETKVVNADNPKYRTFGGKDTEDKIFLLSINEVIKYFDTNKERTTQTVEGKSEWWWPALAGIR